VSTIPLPVWDLLHSPVANSGHEITFPTVQDQNPPNNPAKH